jgi:hypothetical protein
MRQLEQVSVRLVRFCRCAPSVEADDVVVGAFDALRRSCCLIADADIINVKDNALHACTLEC